MKTQFINLNMTPSGINPTFHIAQYDVGRLLGFYVYNGSEVVDLDGYTCTIEATRTDGTQITTDVITTDNQGVFAVTAEMSNEADKYNGQLVIIDSNANRIASLPFIMDVITAALNGNAESISEDRTLYQQYNAAMQAALANETNNRINADNLEKVTRQNAVNTLQTNIDAEATARANAITAEATARTNADTTLQNNIDAEATARQTADSTLQDNINSEASTRASADSNLQTQINQIIAPSGEAPSAVEVQNARIGADGVTYDTLGEAIRANDNKLKSTLLQETAELITDFSNLVGVSEYTQIGGTITKEDEYQYTIVDGIATKSERSNRVAIQFDASGLLSLKLQGSYIGTSEGYPVCFCDANLNVISSITDATQDANHWTDCGNIPIGTKYVCYTKYAGGTDAQFATRLNNTLLIDAMPVEYDDYVGDIAHNLEDTINTWIDGKGVPYTKNGTPINSNSYKYTLLSVKKGDILKAEYSGNYGLHNSMSTFARAVECDTNVYYFRSLSPVTVNSTSHPEYAKSISMIADSDMIIAFTVAKSFPFTLNWYRMPVYGVSVDKTIQYKKFDQNEITKKLVPLCTNYRSGTTIYQRPLVLLHASEPHSAYTSVDDVLDFRNKYGFYLDDVIITGDIVNGVFSDYIPIYQKDGYDKFLLTIGNHDAVLTLGNDNNVASNIDKYNQYFKEQISGWNVVQPTNAVIDGDCYYYKDYSLSGGKIISSTSVTVPKIRLIALDPMAFDEEQYNWLVSTLADAQSNNYSVVIASHQIPMESAGDYTLFTTGFSSLQTGMDSPYGINNYSFIKDGIRYKACDAVDSFINDGGEFICWLNGHMHYDLCGKLNSHPNQIFIAVAQCAINGAWSDTPAFENTPTETIFNCISFDTYVKEIHVARIGAEYDSHLRHKSTMSINYNTKTLVYTE